MGYTDRSVCVTWLVGFLSKLGEEPGVVVDEVTDVGNLILDHGEALDAHPEGEATDFFGVVSGVFSLAINLEKDIWIYDAATCDLDPFVGLAFDLEFQIDFKAGFGKGKEMGPKPDISLRPKHLAEEVFQSSLQISEGHPGVDVKPLQLGENGEVGGIDFIPAISTPRRDDAHGRNFLRHGPDLNGRGVGAEQFAIFEIECVRLVAGGVIFGGVQCIKTMPLGLDFGTFGESKAHPAENVDRFIQNLAEGMEPTMGQRATGQGHIDAGELPGIPRSNHLGAFGFKRFGDCGADFIELLAHVFFLVIGNVPHSGPGRSEATFFAKKADPLFFKFCLAVDGTNCGQSVLLDLLEFCNHEN